MKVLVANRSEIACRIIRSLQENGFPSVAVYSRVDKEAPHVWTADEAVCIGEPHAYLDPQALLQAAKQTGAQAIHPGYGFLSQNAEFAKACEDAGIIFVGPSPKAMSILGDKRASRQAAEKCGIPVVPGEQACDSVDEAQKAAQKVGYPILLKAAGGGGGKGMRLVQNPAQLKEAFASAEREAHNAFHDGRLLVEKYIYPARHVEVQILGDGKNVIALGERECSLQRRYQKVIEESPSAGIDENIRQALCESAVKLGKSVGYKNAGTVEFLVGDTGNFYFLEVNTRLQVEHPVTEIRYGIDLVAWQLAVARGEKVKDPQEKPRGHAIEARLVAEDPNNQFMPSVGEVLELQFPHRPYVRVDTGIVQGSYVSPYYDSLLAKLIAYGEDREQARKRLIEALRETIVLGVKTNGAFLLNILQSDSFKKAQTFTTTLEGYDWPQTKIPEFVSQAAAQLGDVYTEGKMISPWQVLGAYRL
jgi:geranyl-CoA carboxylase alpha subunit